jgi:cytochrome d ubiquinol oxidase subunit I
VTGEWRWISRQDEDARRLAHVWAKLTAVTFAIGAVSGNALSFSWACCGRASGLRRSLIGPAPLEGYAFFIEAIFLGPISTAGRAREATGAAWRSQSAPSPRSWCWP